MNSACLKKENPEIYKNFFNKYDIVISSPIICSLVGDTALYSDLSSSILCQKLPLRNYVGYNIKSSNKNISYISRNDNKWLFDKNIKSDYLVKNASLKEMGLQGELGFLSEYNCLDSLSMTSNLSSLKSLMNFGINKKDYGFILKSDSHILYTRNNEKHGFKYVGIGYDGFERDGVKLEQYRSEGIKSEFISDFELVKYSNGEESSLFGDYDDLKLSCSDGLLLDYLNNKIYLDLKKFNSKQIHSQNTTLEVLKKLLKNIGKKIPNTEFPKSSYSINKNEMSGKIVLPLVKIIEQKKKIKFKFSCNGSITEFNMKLELGNLPIYLLGEVGK